MYMQVARGVVNETDGFTRRTQYTHPHEMYCGWVFMDGAAGGEGADSRESLGPISASQGDLLPPGARLPLDGIAASTVEFTTSVQLPLSVEPDPKTPRIHKAITPMSPQTASRADVAPSRFVASYLTSQEWHRVEARMSSDRNDRISRRDPSRMVRSKAQ